MMDIDKQIAKLLVPVITRMGYELFGIEYINAGRKTILRIYIDSDNGITIDDCERVSHVVSDILDTEDMLLSRRYYLEVSSPGIERPLFTLDHYRRYLGFDIRLTLHHPYQNRRRFTGSIKAVNEHDSVIELATELGNLVLPFAEINKANLLITR